MCAGHSSDKSGGGRPAAGNPNKKACVSSLEGYRYLHIVNTLVRATAITPPPLPHISPLSAYSSSSSPSPSA